MGTKEMVRHLLFVVCRGAPQRTTFFVDIPVAAGHAEEEGESSDADEYVLTTIRDEVINIASLQLCR